MTNKPPFRYRIREARETDVSALCDLVDELFAVEADFEPDRAKARRGLTALLGASEAARLFVAEARGEVIGMCSVQVLVSTAEGGPVGLVEDVVVSKGRRGHGIGAALVGHLESWARERGLKRLQLLADRDNAPALDFYQKRGWQITRLICLRRSEAGD